jgi:hypothetical protein
MKITLRRSCAALLGTLALTLGLSVPASAASSAPTINELYSGYTTPYAHAYYAVGAVFTVPKVNCEASPSPGYSGAAEWVGLGGITFPHEPGSTLVQDGVSTVCFLGAPLYGAVVEIHPPENSPTYLCKVPGVPGILCKYTVQPGDQIFASVNYMGGDNYSLAMADTTQGWHWSLSLAIPDNEVPTTAEWVVEAGTTVGQQHHQVPALANFGSATFNLASYSTAATQGIFLGANNSVTPLPLEVALNRTQLTRVSTVSPPGTFTVKYVGPGLFGFP